MFQQLQQSPLLRTLVLQTFVVFGELSVLTIGSLASQRRVSPADWGDACSIYYRTNRDQRETPEKPTIFFFLKIITRKGPIFTLFYTIRSHFVAHDARIVRGKPCTHNRVRLPVWSSKTNVISRAIAFVRFVTMERAFVYTIAVSRMIERLCKARYYTCVSYITVIYQLGDLRTRTAFAVIKISWGCYW